MNERFSFTDLPLTGLFRIEQKPIMDARGTFTRLFCDEELRAIGFKRPIVQINLSETNRQGTIRGMHYQRPPFAEKKIVTCINGEILDVVVDIRRDSKTFLKWHAETLSATNKTAIYIPEGFAHGFQTLTNHCQLLYFHSQSYAPAHAMTLNALDPAFSIDWPFPVINRSDNDCAAPMIDPQFTGVGFE